MEQRDGPKPLEIPKKRLPGCHANSTAAGWKGFKGWEFCVLVLVRLMVIANGLSQVELMHFLLVPEQI